MRMLIKILLIVSVPLFSSAEDKHPRVAELEDKYKKSAMEFLEARFPGLPFSVTTSIDPLRRNFGNYELKGEQLPFYALDDENVQDEWDDPTATLYTLSNRVKKVEIIIQVPATLKDEELAEIQTTLTSVLRLIPARDEIQIMKRQWTVFPYLKLYAGAFGLGLFIFFLGLFIVSRLFAGRMASALEGLKGKQQEMPSQQSMPSLPQSPASSSNEPKTSGDVRFQDPIKIREVAHREVEEIVEHGDFIRLENFLRLDQLGREDHRTLGALLLLFPIEVQKELFSLSSGSHWMKAFNKPGDVNFKCLELLEELSRVNPNQYNKNWEYLLICLWRMGSEEAVPFLRGMGSEQAMSVLNDMPKNISVPMAREAFPGNWAAILDPKFVSKKIDSDTCVKLANTALESVPLMDFNLLNTYRRESDLLTYLDEADIRTEKEIYDASPEDSIVKTMRPPFYKVFDGDKTELEVLAKEFSVDHWSIALFNVPRDMRKNVESVFSEKERFFYYEKLKSLDGNRPDVLQVAEIRNSIAQRFKEISSLTNLNELDNESDYSHEEEHQEEDVA